MTDARSIDATTSPYLAHLPIGVQLPPPTDGIPFWDVCPYDGDVQIKVLQEPELPEPPRWGENSAEDCGCATDPDRNLVWTDGVWKVTHAGEPTAVPAMVLLKPVGHYDLLDLPPDLAAGMGPMIQRVERAIMRLGGVGRVHVNKWGDGGAHLHLWLIGRPAGMVQLRGTCLPLWEDVLPKMPYDLWVSSLTRIGEALASDGGEARLVVTSG
jgi:diadenosine tetraphosphate (Ap4A) HIT family hydrolase